MNASGNERTTPSVEDGDGVRVIREPRARPSVTMVFGLLVTVMVVAGIAWVVPWPQHSTTPTGRAGGADAAPDSASAAQLSLAAQDTVAASTTRPARRESQVQAMDSSPGPDDLPTGDPNDLATYVSPSDPEPTAAEVIQALHDMGDHTGIGAFNPPGTSPPLVGLAVPDDFILPEGYVRHHQVTDEGEPLEPILMFSPDVVFVDDSGRQVPIPEDLVVPPHMAPPGLPIREIAIPPKQ